MDIEFVCTGNQCRSPMAEAFARRRFSQRDLDVTVTSSGLLGPDREPPDEVVELMAARDLDVTGHRSRTLDADIIASADLILAMERRHLTELVAITPEAYTRAFTLPEFVRRVEGLGLEGGGPPDLTGLIEAIALTRGRRDLLRIGVADEIPDPMGRSRKTFEGVAGRIDALVTRLVELVWPAPEDAEMAVGR